MDRLKRTEPDHAGVVDEDVDGNVGVGGEEVPDGRFDGFRVGRGEVDLDVVQLWRWRG